MQIKEVTELSVTFDNGYEITFDHVPYSDCCEYNYAAFKQIEERALEIEFDEKLIFEAERFEWHKNNQSDDYIHKALHIEIAKRDDNTIHEIIARVVIDTDKEEN